MLPTFSAVLQSFNSESPVLPQSVDFFALTSASLSCSELVFLFNDSFAVSLDVSDILFVAALLHGQPFSEAIKVTQNKKLLSLPN